MSTAQHELLPILVGVTGKRTFDDPDHPKLAASSRKQFETRFRALIGALDRRLPDVPKVLVCGGAAGVDLDSVAMILEEDAGRQRFPGWTVTIVLPLDISLFQEDFENAPAALEQLRSYIAGHPRVIVKSLRRLRKELFDDSNWARRSKPARTETHELSRDNTDRDPTERRNHYEQLGLWLARYSTILIAVCPPETPNKIGGTARVVAYRRSGIPDDIAHGVISRSCELLHANPLEEPDGGQFLWLDPTAEAAGIGDMEMVQPLLPIQQIFDVRHPGSSTLKVRDNLYADPFQGSVVQHDVNRKDAVGSALALPDAFQLFHGRRRTKAERGTPAEAVTAGPDHPAEFLEKIRKNSTSLGRQQTSATNMTKWTLRLAACLFLLGAAFYETYIEVLHDLPVVLAGYVAMLGAIWALSKWVQNYKIQVRSEDYRGLREMLRVQAVWWSTGIDRMVDRVHLRSIDSNLRLVREAAATIGVWALLRCDRMRGFDVEEVHRLPPGNGTFLHFANEWIKDQGRYYHRGAKAYAGVKRLADYQFSVNLGTVMVLSVGLIVGLTWFEHELDEAVGQLHMPAMVLLPFAAAIVAMAVLAVITGRPFGSGRPGAVWYIPEWLDGFALLGVMALAFMVVKPAICVCVTGVPVHETGVSVWPPVFLVALACLVCFRIPNDVRELDVAKLQLRHIVWLVTLVACMVVILALVFEPFVHGVLAHGANGGHRTDAFKALVLMTNVLLLAGAAMVRWYSERRNHSAQALHYDDMLRAFRRAADWLQQNEGHPIIDLQRHVIELGELALDENEAWLKAHRERPMEPIAGG